jgi:hypothetical protein
MSGLPTAVEFRELMRSARREDRNEIWEIAIHEAGHIMVWVALWGTYPDSSRIWEEEGRFYGRTEGDIWVVTREGDMTSAETAAHGAAIAGGNVAVAVAAEFPEVTVSNVDEMIRAISEYGRLAALIGYDPDAAGSEGDGARLWVVERIAQAERVLGLNREVFEVVAGTLRTERYLDADRIAELVPAEATRRP